MADADTFARPYLFVDVHQPATSAAVAQLLEAVAAALRAHGEVIVQHVAFEAGDRAADASISLSVYYDRVERRRTARD